MNTVICRECGKRVNKKEARRKCEHYFCKKKCEKKFFKIKPKKRIRNNEEESQTLALRQISFSAIKCRGASKRRINFFRGF